MRHRNILVALVILLLAAVPVFASHGWGSYHWGRSCSTCAVSINVYSSLTYTNTNWADHLNKSIYGDAANPNTANRRGWDASPALTLSRVGGAPAATTDSTTRANCPAINAAVRVCNYSYGANGWLGLASINTVSGSASHIAWGTAKMNDSYFASGYPSTEKRHVMCQEVGHDFGLGHTSENGSSQNTCMDYYRNTSSSDWTSTGPNQHDFDQLLTQHHWGAKTFLPGDAATLKPIRFPGDTELNAPWQWGTPMAWDNQGRADLFKLDLGTDSEGNEHALWTHVIWADPITERTTEHPSMMRLQE
jgi:hypothetical protein